MAFFVFLTPRSSIAVSSQIAELWGKRARLRDRPYAYLIELSVDGEPLPSVDEHRSASLNTAQALKRFRDQRAGKAPQNQGILQAIHTTLFWNAALYPERMKTIPSFRSLKQANP